jgi:hypothetical protein
MKDEKLNFFGKVFRQETVEGQKLPVGSICQQLPTICQQIIRKYDFFVLRKISLLRIGSRPNSLFIKVCVEIFL